MDRLAAALAAQYRIERELGAGGMATVYLAEDLKHHRRVAIKVLRPDLAAAVGPGRFEDEVEIAARLHHPHIVPVYDSGAADGFLYYVMPLIEGQTLRERVQQGERLPVPDVVRILAEAADALAYAHDHGLVHRDIKPENIMMSGRHALVMDFGIAKAVRDAGARRSSTSLGLAMGTPEYMSPEQASGDPNLDHRADIYSLGVVGYELLTGKPPFAGGGTEQILTRHITQPPAPIGTLRPDVPPALAAVLMRALAKSPGERWQTAEAMGAQLEPMMNTTSGQVAATRALGTVRRPRNWAWLAAAVVVLLGVGAAWTWWGGKGRAGSPGASAVAADAASRSPAQAGAAGDGAAGGIPDLATDPSVAVLPFENMSSDKEQVYFSDGISEELLNLLAKVPKLRVIARTSSFQFKGKDLGIQAIARQLHVASILEGSVRKSGDTVRITAQLVRASDGSQLWSETYDRKLDDVFAVQDEIAAKVVDSLKLTLLGAKPTARPVDPRVYPLLLQAKAIADLNTRQGRQDALAIYKRALAITPDEARVHAGMARMYLNQVVNLEGDVEDNLARGRKEIDRALALDPGNAQAHGFRARIAADYDADFALAAKEASLAVSLDPSSSAMNATGALLMSIGRAGDSVRWLRRMTEVDPANAISWANYQIALGLADKCAEGMEAGRQALSLSPDYPEAHALIGNCLIRGGRAAEAVAEIGKEAYAASRMQMLAIAYQALGRKAEADAMRAKLEAEPAQENAFYLATVHAQQGNADAAFRELDRAIRQRDSGVVSMSADWLLAPLRKDARWLPLLRRIGRAPEQLARIKFDLAVPK
jgi:serine/threonine-protein kinase